MFVLCIAFSTMIILIIFGFLGLTAGLVALVQTIKTRGRKIIVLGMQGAGKTTFLNSLRGEYYQEVSPTAEEKYPKFSTKIGSRDVWISDGIDYGGGDAYVTQYEDMLKNKEIVFFVFDLSKYLTDIEYKRRTNSRLQLLYSIAKRRSIDVNNNVVVIGSHYDEVKKKMKDVKNALSELQSKSYGEMFLSNVFAIDTRDEKNIDELKEKVF